MLKTTAVSTHAKNRRTDGHRYDPVRVKGLRTLKQDGYPPHLMHTINVSVYPEMKLLLIKVPLPTKEFLMWMDMVNLPDVRQFFSSRRFRNVAYNEEVFQQKST